MAYDLVGCMEFSGGKYRPIWTNPCTESDMVGCMEFSGGKYRPKLIDGFGICTDDKTGCMKLDGGVHKPTLIYDEYNSLAEMQADCCISCPPCWGEGSPPQYVQVTFANLRWCPTQPPCDYGEWDLPGVLNTSFILEAGANTHSEAVCAWCYDDVAATGVSVILRLIFLGGNYLIGVYYMWCPATATYPASPSLMFAQSIPTSDCSETDLSNFYDSGWCRTSPAWYVRAYGGTATIDWNP